MDFDVELSGGSPWGFRIQGGKEFHSPIKVTFLKPGGKAASCQKIRVGDQLREINGQDTFDLTHTQAEQLIKRTGTTLRLSLHRPESTKPIPPPATTFPVTKDDGESSTSPPDPGVVTRRRLSSASKVETVTVTDKEKDPDWYRSMFRNTHQSVPLRPIPVAGEGQERAPVMKRASIYEMEMEKVNQYHAERSRRPSRQSLTGRPQTSKLVLEIGRSHEAGAPLRQYDDFVVENTTSPSTATTAQSDPLDYPPGGDEVTAEGTAVQPSTELPPQKQTSLPPKPTKPIFFKPRPPKSISLNSFTKPGPTVRNDNLPFPKPLVSPRPKPAPVVAPKPDIVREEKKSRFKPVQNPTQPPSGTIAFAEMQPTMSTKQDESRTQEELFHEAKFQESKVEVSVEQETNLQDFKTEATALQEQKLQDPKTEVAAVQRVEEPNATSPENATSLENATSPENATSLENATSPENTTETQVEVQKSQKRSINSESQESAALTTPTKEPQDNFLVKHSLSEGDHLVEPRLMLATKEKAGASIDLNAMLFGKKSADADKTASSLTNVDSAVETRAAGPDSVEVEIPQDKCEIPLEVPAMNGDDSNLENAESMGAPGIPQCGEGTTPAVKQAPGSDSESDISDGEVPNLKLVMFSNHHITDSENEADHVAMAPQPPSNPCEEEEEPHPKSFIMIPEPSDDDDEGEEEDHQVVLLSSSGSCKVVDTAMEGKNTGGNTAPCLVHITPELV